MLLDQQAMSDAATLAMFGALFGIAAWDTFSIQHTQRQIFRLLYALERKYKEP